VQLAKNMLRFGSRARHPHALASRSSIGLEHGRKTHPFDPVPEVPVFFDDPGLWSSDSFFPRQLQESGSRLQDRKGLRRPERALNQRPNFRRFPRMQPFPAIQLVQVPDGKIVSGQKQIGLRDGDRADQGAQWGEALVRMRAAHGLRLARRMPGRTQHLDPEPCISESHGQAGRGHPIRRRYN
jgi:hypothetical protein